MAKLLLQESGVNASMMPSIV